MNGDARYLVWSNQKGMWWYSARSGYTDLIDDAGRYSYAEAKEIVARATLDGRLTSERLSWRTGRRTKTLDEVVVLAPESTQFPEGEVE